MDITLQPEQVSCRFAGRNVFFDLDDSDDHIANEIRKSKTFYEIDLLTEMFHRAMPGDVFIDVGAHIGNHSLFLAGIAGLQGIAIEPNISCFRQLANNIEINNLLGQMQLINASVGGKSGRCNVVVVDDHNSGMSRIEEDHDGTVPIITIDSLQLDRLDILKIDVEGYEMEVLRGARSALLRHKPLVVIEAMDSEAFSERKDWLREVGYMPKLRFCVTPTYIFTHRCA